MEQIIYASKVAMGVGQAEILQILDVAHKANAKHEISGFLACDGSYFLQLIEGSSDNLRLLLESIKRDTRHQDIKVLGIRMITARDFTEWSMGFVNQTFQIEKAIEAITNSREFLPLNYTFEEAKAILTKLSKMV